jgi:hypothetical protein
LDEEAHGADGADTRDDFQHVNDFLPLSQELPLLECGFGVVVGEDILAVPSAVSTTSEGSGIPKCKFIQSYGQSEI